MKKSTLNKLQEGYKGIAKHYYKQIYVLEDSKTDTVAYFGKENGYPVLNINILLSKKIKDLPAQQRPFKISGILNDLINEFNSQTVCIDNFEILFEPSLKIKPFNLFSNLSRSKTLIIAWRGVIKDDYFIYAEHDHPEYIRHSTKDVMVIK